MQERKKEDKIHLKYTHTDMFLRETLNKEQSERKIEIRFRRSSNIIEWRYKTFFQTNFFVTKKKEEFTQMYIIVLHSYLHYYIIAFFFFKSDSAMMMMMENTFRYTYLQIYVFRFDSIRSIF